MNSILTYPFFQQNFKNKNFSTSLSLVSGSTNCVIKEKALKIGIDVSLSSDFIEIFSSIKFFIYLDWEWASFQILRKEKFIEDQISFYSVDQRKF